MSEAVTVVTARPARRMVARAVVASVSAGVLCLACLGVVTMLSAVDDNPPGLGLGCGDGQAVDPYGVLPHVESLTEEMVRNAAHAARAGQPVSLSGQAPYVEAVKAQLVREGIPAAQIRVSAWKRSFLPSPGDGLANPEARSVQIDF